MDGGVRVETGSETEATADMSLVYARNALIRFREPTAKRGMSLGFHSLTWM